MKKIISLLSLLIVLTYNSNAQFNYDSTQPFYVCNASGAQYNVRLLSPYSGANSLVFWMDERNGPGSTEIYAQLLDASGNPLWGTNGKPIVSGINKDIFEYNVVLWQFGFLVSWAQGPAGLAADSLMCQFYNLSGNPFWTSPVVIAESASSGIVYFSNSNGAKIHLIESASDLWVTWQAVYPGGSSGMRFNKMDQTGSLTWPVNGQPAVPNGYAPYETCSDSAGGFYMMYTTGGINADIYLQHYDPSGGGLFSNPVNMTTGFAGRGYKWSMIADGASNFYFVWDSGTGDVYITKYNTDGTPAWNPAAKTICSASLNQINANAIYYNGNIYSTWADQRPPANNYFIYIQKTDTAGNMIWTNDGEISSNLPSIIPHPKVGLLSGGNILNVHRTAFDGFRAQRFQPNANTSWAMNGVPVYNGVNTSGPFDNDFQMHNTANDNMVIAWSSSSDIYAAKLLSNGILADVKELNNEALLNVYPNPVQNTLWINNNFENNSMNLQIFDISGRLIIEQYVGGTQLQQSGIDVSILHSGTYSITLNNEENQYHSLFIKQ